MTLHHRRNVLKKKPWRWKLLASPMIPLSLAASPLSAVVLTLCCLASGLLADECPTLCDCKWKSGKESVICLNSSLNMIPQRLAASTQVLDLTGNSLSTVGKDAFLDAGLINLQRIYLAKCRIKILDRYAFRKLTNLVELDLSFNLLPSVPSHVFDSISELWELRLSGNPIQRVLNDAFLYVPKLVRLELSHCKIGTVEARAFSGLENSLEWLKLDGNKLVQIKPSTVIAMRNLHGLELADNPWNCSCGLRPLREWLLRQNIPHGAPPVCNYPKRLQGKPWDRLELDEFACVPEIATPDTAAMGVEGHNVTMTCRVGGVPEPRVRWMWRNRVIANLSGGPGRKLYLVHVSDAGSNLTILTADTQDAGVYVCSAENKAGRVEASVTLAVSRRPLDSGFSGRVLAASIIVAALFLLALCLVALCVCSVKKRQQGVWHGQDSSNEVGGHRRRDDSYEKIEMNHKPPVLTNHTGGTSPKNNGTGVASPGLEVAVVGPLRQHRRGEYRGVPSVDTDLGEEDAEEGDDEEEGGYEDEVETPTPTTIVAGSREGRLSWGAVRSLEETDNRDSNVRIDCVDLHIPRSISYLDRREEQTSPQENLPHPAPLTSISCSLNASDMTSMVVMRKQTVGRNGGTLYTSAPPPSTQDPSKNYPDLLEISPYNLDSSSYCTLPRRRGAAGGGVLRGSSRYSRYGGAGSDSQSPLLPDSRYSSGGSDMSIRRSSIDSYSSSSYYPLSSGTRDKQQRSSSSLNLASSPVTSTGSSTGSGRPTRNPSLPASPVRGQSHNIATPLLNLSALGEASSPSPVSSVSTTVNSNTYDYHAAQLERFLEEYRSLQEQLCKMKETCENIRHQDVVTERKYAEPLYGGLTTPSGSDDSGGGNPRSILKNKSSSSVAVTVASGGPLSGSSGGASSTLPSVGAVDYGSELPSYWLPRNSLMRRYSGGDFFQS